MKAILPELKFNNPIDEGKLDEIISLLDIEATDTIVDIGGGDGKVLLKMIKESKAKGILIDLDEKLVESCRANAAALVSAGKLVLAAEDAKTYLKKLAHNSVDCFVALGSSYAFDSYLNFMKEVLPYLKTGGFILAGEQFWIKKPAKEYLETLGGEESESGYHHENISGPEELGLTYLYSQIASREDWDRFEGIYFMEEEMNAMKLPEAERKERREKLRAFRNAQFKYGRDTMGFGLYLFTKQ